MTCGSGTQKQTYSISTPAQNGGTACPATNGQVNSRTCTQATCPGMYMRTFVCYTCASVSGFFFLFIFLRFSWSILFRAYLQRQSTVLDRGLRGRHVQLHVVPDSERKHILLKLQRRMVVHHVQLPMGKRIHSRVHSIAVHVCLYRILGNNTFMALRAMYVQDCFRCCC